jgi:Rrf2 family protein
VLELSATAGYALQALSCLHTAPGRWVLARDIAARTRVAGPYLSRILYTLVKAGLISAKRGYRGGFRLARPAERLSVMEIVEAVEKRPRSSHCLLGLAECSDRNGCPVHVLWKAARARVEESLARLTLAEVAAAMLKREPGPGASSATAAGKTIDRETIRQHGARPRSPRHRPADKG